MKTPWENDPMIMELFKLELGMNLLAATPSCDCATGKNLWVWDMCVFQIMACIWFSIIYNTSIKIDMFYFNIMSFLRVAVVAATDCVSQSRCSILGNFGMGVFYI